MGKKRHIVYSKKSKGNKKKKKNLDNEDLYFAQQEKLEREKQQQQKREHKQVRQLEHLQKEAKKEEERAPPVKTAYELLLAQLGARVEEDGDEDEEMSEGEDEYEYEEIGEEEEEDEDENEEEAGEGDEKGIAEQENKTLKQDKAEDVHHEVFGDESESENEDSDREEAQDEDEDHFLSFFRPVDETEWGKESVDSWPRGEAHGTTPLGASRAALRNYCLNKNLAAKADALPSHGPKALPLFHYMDSYRDVHLTDHNYKSNDLARDMYTLHVTNHVMKARARVMKYNAKMKKGTAAEIPGEEGFCRLKCLIVVPYRSACYDVVNRILSVCPSAKQVMNKSRFEDEFRPEEQEEAPTDDYSHLMAGNNDDKFRIGLSFARSCIKLYTPFYRSDVLVCSPLGLRLIIGSKDDKKREYDFLSSLDILVLDRCDALRMQNWDHLLECIQVLNVQPDKLPENCDIRRLRQAFVNKQGRLFRQTIATSSGHFADVQSLFVDRFQPPQSRKQRKHDDSDEEEKDVMREAIEPVGPRKNFRGLVQLGIKSEGAPLKQGIALGMQRQLFLMLECPAPTAISDTTFEGFKEKFWPTASGLNRLLLVVAGSMGYADFLRLRNFFESEGVNYCACHEYSSNQALSRSRKEFFDGTNRVMIISERWWWFRRYRIKGAEQILFYGVPETETLYSEALSWMRAPTRCNAMTLAMIKWDAPSLERIVGHTQVKPMMRAKANKIFSFASSPVDA
eukprot:GEMP01025152.1.p1 GENE.GEMP01025152.1~~GEMP01025152.1.p1  ORF type:complete len:737 (-),score=182.91 GEMP01025152.1:82-2292(-)